MTSSVIARFVAVGILSSIVLPACPESRRDDLTARSLVDLMDMEVTSVSKKEQKVSETASAIFVITQDEIKRSGVTSVTDLLRMVPGVEVAQINSNKWAISVRGFNGQYSNKLLVLIDGRTVYSPIMSGVFWEEQDVPLQSIDRLEIIRGPGATVWGANAVNGVINVITKKASDTQGGLLVTGGGTYRQGDGALSYGGRLGSAVAYRVSADGFLYNHLPDVTGHSGQDDWKLVHGGFRMDAYPSARNSITLEGDGHSGNEGGMSNSTLPTVDQAIPLNDRFSGWDLLSRWDHVSSPHSAQSLQVYFDRNTRGNSTYGFDLNTIDIDFQHHVGWGSRQDFVWGLGYRVSSDRTKNPAQASFNPASRTTQLFSSFVQDEISLLPGRVALTPTPGSAGSYEHGECIDS